MQVKTNPSAQLVLQPALVAVEQLTFLPVADLAGQGVASFLQVGCGPTGSCVAVVACCLRCAS
jgi:hypothetical protein